MKKLLWKIVLVLILPILCECQSSNNQQKEEADHTEEQNPVKTLSLPYVATLDSQTQELKMEENPEKSAIALNKEELTEALNLKYPDIKLQVGESYHDTLNVRIPEATDLTQQYGTTGAQTYMAEVTYAFTTLPGIKVVNFDFKEGDHAVPGPYSRESFKKSL